MGLLHRIWHPPVFQGPGRRKNYFEGWYHKHVPAAGGSTISIIGGIAYDGDRNGQAFVQIIHGSRSEYISYPIEDFRWESKKYEIYIGPNKFSENEINLHIDRPEISIHAELKYSNQTPLGGRSLTAPGIMGWYRFVPRMECYHGVVSLDHDITGTIEIDGTAIDMTGGRGYIEKDWGSSMPSEWIWFQANSFSSPHSSVMFSVARIPWMGDSFPGFLAICHTDNHQHLFTTYNKSCISASEINNTTVHICFRNSSHELNIETSYTTAAELTAPVRGLMERSISESTDAQARIRLSTIDGYIEFEDRSNPAAIELAGPVQNLLRDVRACPGNRR